MEAGSIPLANLSLIDLEGRIVSLKETATRRFLLIIFLRHLA
jgi:hypothetical protein